MVVVDPEGVQLDGTKDVPQVGSDSQPVPRGDERGAGRE